MQCNKCDSDVERFHKEVKSNHDGDERTVEMYACVECDREGKVFSDHGGTIKTGILRE